MTDYQQQLLENAVGALGRIAEALERMAPIGGVDNYEGMISHLDTIARELERGHDQIVDALEQADKTLKHLVAVTDSI